MDILDDFIQKAQSTLQEGYYNVEKVKTQRNSLREKLESQEFSVITEIKHASPSGDYSFRDIDVGKTAKLFRESGADAISCVVEPKVFKGKLENVTLAKSAGLPVLFKDFIFCEEQIEAVRKVGADAILLIVKMAERVGLDLDCLIESAHSHGLEVLLESYDANELNTALETDADVLGINNRDLRTLTVDITRTSDILSSAEIDRPLISESGVKTAQDVAFVKSAGASGVLVGTAVWTAEDIGEKIQELKKGVSNE